MRRASRTWGAAHEPRVVGIAGRAREACAESAIPMAELTRAVGKNGFGLLRWRRSELADADAAIAGGDLQERSAAVQLATNA